MKQFLLTALFVFCSLEAQANIACPDSFQKTMHLELRFEVEKDGIDSFHYDLTFFTSLDQEEYTICIHKKHKKNNEEIKESILEFSFTELAELNKEMKVIISSPVKIRGKYPGLVFLDRKSTDSNNFFGISYPKEVKLFGSKWGWIPVIIDNQEVLSFKTLDGDEYHTFSKLEIFSENMLYKSKMGYKRVPLGIKNYVVKF